MSGLVGFIGAMTESFCDACNRVRVGADGALRACLGGRDRVGLEELLRAGATDAEIADRSGPRSSRRASATTWRTTPGGLLPMIGTGG